MCPKGLTVSRRKMKARNTVLYEGAIAPHFGHNTCTSTCHRLHNGITESLAVARHYKDIRLSQNLRNILPQSHEFDIISELLHEGMPILIPAHNDNSEIGILFFERDDRFYKIISTFDGFQPSNVRHSDITTSFLQF